MQMISRRINEGLVIGDDIEVTVLEILEDHVRLGITSPNEFPSYREELLYFSPEKQARELQVH